MKKPFIVEWRFARPVKNWSLGREWRVQKRYSSRKRRDEGLRQFRKNSNGLFLFRAIDEPRGGHHE